MNTSTYGSGASSIGAAVPVPSAFDDLFARALALPAGAFGQADTLCADVISRAIPADLLPAFAQLVAAKIGKDPGAVLRMLHGAWAARHGTTAPGVVSWSTMPSVMDEASALPLLNQRLAFVRDCGGRPTYVVICDDGSSQLINPAEGEMHLAPHSVRVAVGNGSKLVQAWWHWTHSPMRMTYDRRAYDPEGKLATQGFTVLNTWRGFAIAPRPGPWRLTAHFLLHIICSGKRTVAKYLFRWLAHAVQRPGTAPHTMVVLRSNLEGVGKSTVGYLMKKIFGAHALEVSDPDLITGKFNESLEAKTFVLVEEAPFPGAHSTANRLKATITAHEHLVNPKGHKPYAVPNTAHLMLATNERWAVPAGAAARRFLVVDVPQKRDLPYYQRLYAEIEGGGAEAFLLALLKCDLSRFSPRDVPITAALVQQQRMSADDITQWITDSVVAREIVPGSPGGGFGQTVPAAQLYAAYLAWAATQRVPRPKNQVAFGRELTSLGMVRAKSNVSTWTVPLELQLLQNADARAGIRKITV